MSEVQVSLDPRRRASQPAQPPATATATANESALPNLQDTPVTTTEVPSEQQQTEQVVQAANLAPSATESVEPSPSLSNPPAASLVTPSASDAISTSTPPPPPPAAAQDANDQDLPTVSVSDSAAMEAAIAATLAAAEAEEAEDMEVERGSPSPPPVPIKPEPVDHSLPPISPARSLTPTLLETGKQAALAFAAKTKLGAGSLSRVAQLNSRIEKDPLDAEARLALIGDAEQKGDLERIRESYEAFLSVFPDADAQWIAYANLELSHSLFPQVEAIFARCLRPSPSVDLWKFYLDYIRRINPIDLTQTERAKEARSVIAKSFEFALAHVGQDRRAGDMWMEYIGFLKEGQNRGTWEDQQRMDSLRKAYTRAVCIPLNNVEQIWQEYNTFENNLNKMTAKKFVAELSPSYMTARKALRELRALFDGLYLPPLPHRPDWYSSTQDRDRLALWRKYLLWEEANPLDIEDQAALQARVSFAYKKALVGLRFFSEAWYLSANYNTRMGKVEEGRSLLQAGLAANPSSVLLAYTLAELEEGAGDVAACYKIYEGLIESFHGRLSALQAATEKEITDAIAAFDAEAETEEQKPEMTNGDDEEHGGKTVQEKEERKTEIRAKSQPEIDSVKRSAANVWVTMMRFARRAEGVKQARSIFTRARKAPSLVWQIVEASASMELYWNNDAAIATKVYELGLKTFAQEPEYILCYLDFLIRSNNPNNARALFERSIAVIEPAKAKSIWERMAQYEYQYGDYLAAQKIFQRYVDAFPDASPIDRFAKRHGYLDLSDAFIEDLGPETIEPPRRRSRSPSPHRTNKRGHSTEPEGPAFERATYDGSKRMKQFHQEGSPAPSSQGGRDDGPPRGRWGEGEDHEGPPPPRGGPPPPRGGAGPPNPMPPRGPPRPVPFALNPRGDEVAVLPEPLVFFISNLPSTKSYNGPMINPAAIVDIINNTILPPPGERLGVPPRGKPEIGGWGSPMPPSGGSRGNSPPPHLRRGGGDYGYGPPGRGGRRY